MNALFILMTSPGADPEKCRKSADFFGDDHLPSFGLMCLSYKKRTASSERTCYEEQIQTMQS